MNVLLLLLLSAQAVLTAPEAAEAEAEAVAAVPGSEILLFDIIQGQGGIIELSAGKNITQRIGYDSQPRFSKDGTVLYYSRDVKAGNSSQMDIYQYELLTGQTKAYLSTAESEYSPTPMLDGASLSVVQVDASGDQYIVILDAEAENPMKRYSDLKQVGYFNWTTGDINWSFVLNDSNGGDLYHMGKDKKTVLLSENVGRTFVNDATKKLIYYVDKNTTPWRIKSRQSELHEAKDIMALPAGVEDFTVDSKGRFWAGQNNALLISTDQQKWQNIHTFEFQDLQQISRLTTNPTANKIAIVFAEKTRSE